MSESGLEVDRTDLNVQERSIHEPRVTVVNSTSARHLNLVNPDQDINRTYLNVQERSLHEPCLTVGNSRSARHLNLVNPDQDTDRTDINVQERSNHEPRLTVGNSTSGIKLILSTIQLSNPKASGPIPAQSRHATSIVEFLLLYSSEMKFEANGS